MRFAAGAVIVSSFLVFTNVVLAVSDGVTISQTIGDDITPPTVPTPVVAAPVASTQIDVSWGASTDDQSLTGYRLFRDAVQIATTSLTTYSDTGLTASTTYTYYVEAYDWFLNISSTSVSVATTTLGLPVTPSSSASSTSTSNAGSQLSPRLISLRVEPSQENAQFTWDTNIYTRYLLRWGVSSEYDLGLIQNDVYSRTHTTNVRNLEPGTRYMFALVGINQRGREFLLERGSFTTQDEKDITAPSNVSSARTIVENDSVYIQWVNPLDADFTKVRIVRNHLFYPSDSVDGFIVYEGSSQSVFDADALSEYPDQYYTIFAYDATGNISSGAVVFAKRGEENTVIDNGGDTTVSSSSVAKTIDIVFSDVRFIQENEVLVQEGQQVVIDSKVPLSIHLPVDLLPDYLKTIVVTLTGANDHAQSYILHNNSQNTRYQALLRNLPEGVYEASFSIYDYHTQLQTTFDGQIISQKWISSNNIQDTDAQGSPSETYSFLTEYGLVAGLFLILWLLLVARRSREDN